MLTHQLYESEANMLAVTSKNVQSHSFTAFDVKYKLEKQDCYVNTLCSQRLL